MNFEDLAFLFTSDFRNRGLCRLDVDEAACLYRRVKEAGTYGVEIGRFRGGSTLLLASAVGSAGALLSIDKAPRGDDVLKQRLGELLLQNRVLLHVGDSGNYPYKPKTDLSFDFVFVDGDHSYEGAKRDHLTWGRRLRVGGLIIHHDMAKARPNATQIKDLARLREDILTHQASCVELVEEVGSISVFRRKGSCWKSF